MNDVMENKNKWPKRVSKAKGMKLQILIAKLQQNAEYKSPEINQAFLRLRT